MATMREDPAVKGGRIGGKIGGPKGGEASLHSEKVSASGLAVCLKGIDFPANKTAIIDNARLNHCSDNVLEFINRLPEREYQYPTDVEVEFGKMKSR